MINGDATATAINPPQNDNGVPFSQHMVRSLAAAAQVPYELVSADLANQFSQARFGDRFFRRRTVQVQKTILEPQFLNRVFRRFVALESPVREDQRRPRNPRATKMALAGIRAARSIERHRRRCSAVAAGFASRAEIIAKRGRDISAVDAGDRSGPEASAATEPKPIAQEPANVGDPNVQIGCRLRAVMREL